MSAHAWEVPNMHRISIGVTTAHAHSVTKSEPAATPADKKLDKCTSGLLAGP